MITLPNGNTFRLGSLRRDSSGRGVVELFGDLKRHDMGPRLAESVNEIAGDDATPIPSDPRNRHTPSTFLTENLWGVGSTAPYRHDGRATTIAEAILEHASSASNDPSEAAFARRNYLNLTASDKRAVIARRSPLGARGAFHSGNELIVCEVRRNVIFIPSSITMIFDLSGSRTAHSNGARHAPTAAPPRARVHESPVHAGGPLARRASLRDWAFPERVKLFLGTLLFCFD